MDANKLKVLEDIDYKIRRACGNCQHGIFKGVKGDNFGVCNIHVYQHLKHSEDISKLSINKYGSCGQHFMSGDYVAGIGDFVLFTRE